MKTPIILFLLIIGSIGCSKDPGEKDTVMPVITITNPSNGEVFTAGQSIHITGTITDDKFIAEVHVHVTNTNTGALLMDVHLYPTGVVATIDQSITAVAGINYKIQVIAKDRAVNEATTSVQVSCN